MSDWRDNAIMVSMQRCAGCRRPMADEERRQEHATIDISGGGQIYLAFICQGCFDCYCGDPDYCDILDQAVIAWVAMDALLRSQQADAIT